MKNPHSFVIRHSSFVIVLCILACALCIRAHAQTNYTNHWFTFDGPGGSCTGGVYFATGSVGQPEVGLLRGDDYTANSGFWGAIAIQMPARPFLSIDRVSANAVIISWTTNAPGFTLQAAPVLGNSNLWSTVSSPVFIVGSNYAVTNGISGTNYFRLQR